jgi:hypothetical protein
MTVILDFPAALDPTYIRVPGGRPAFSERLTGSGVMAASSRTFPPG